MEKLILWDIDGTLIASGGVSGDAMRAAMAQVYGRPMSQDRNSYAGKTDQQIIFETFADREPAELQQHLGRFALAYKTELAAHKEDLLTRGEVLPGVVDMLKYLSGKPVVQALLTGNLRLLAHYKLQLMGIEQFFDFDASAFGGDHHMRTMLVPIAAERAAQRYGRPFTGADVVVIGDTPNDIDCGRAAGARTVAVATGPFDVEMLRAHGADAALPDLSDTEVAARAILQML